MHRKKYDRKHECKSYKSTSCFAGCGKYVGIDVSGRQGSMEAGITGLTLANMRMIGAAVCFWTTSFFVKQEKVNPHDLLMLFFASLLGIVCNQGCFTFGLSLTSPVDASIMTTTMPIVTMILAALFLKEPVTPKKVIGIFLGPSVP